MTFASLCPIKLVYVKAHRTLEALRLLFSKYCFEFDCRSSPFYFIHSGGSFSFIGRYPFYCQCFGIERGNQNTLQVFHLSVSLFFLSLYNPCLKLSHPVLTFVPLNCIPVAYIRLWRCALRVSTTFHCCFFIQKFSGFPVTNHHVEVCLFSQRMMFQSLSTPLQGSICFFHNLISSPPSTFLAVGFPFVTRER